MVVSDSCAIRQCPFYRICEQSSCHASSVAYEPCIHMEFKVCFPATSEVTFFSQKCLKVLEFLTLTEVLCDIAPVFREPIDSTFCMRILPSYRICLLHLQMETLFGCLYFLQSHDFMCEMYLFSTFVTTSPEFRAESCLLTFPLPSIFPCVATRFAFLPTSLFASYYERLGQARIVPFSTALHFRTILTGTLLWHA